MIPCLYDVSETEYKTNGIGKLVDCVSCYVTEKRNGSYELKMEYPADGVHADKLTQGRIILAKPADNKPSQPFRIYKVTSDLSGIMEIDARHISYQLNYITVSPTSVVNGGTDQVNAAFNALKENATTDCPFSFRTDMTSSAYFGILEPVSFRSALGGVDGSMLDTFGGEFEWDFYTVRLLKSRGSDNGVRIVYGKNLVDYKQEKNDEDVITGVHPYWKDNDSGEIYELTEKVVTLEKSSLPYERIGLLDCSTEFDEEPTQTQLREYARSYLETTSLTEPAIDIDIDFAQLWQTAGYEDIAEAERVSLCDTVHVYLTSLGIMVDATVTETEYDVLLERYKSITLSNSPTSSRNSSISLTVATTSQVKSMIAMTDSSIRLTVSNIYATKATLENDYSTTVQTRSLIEASADAVTLAFNQKLSDDYSTTSEIETMIKLSEDGIALTYTKNGEVRSQFALESDSITISSGTITFNAGRLLINGDNLTLNSSGVLTTASGNYKQSMGSGAVSIYYSDTEMGRLRSAYWNSDNSKRGFTINLINADYSGFAINGTLGFIYNNSLNPDGYTNRNIFSDSTRFESTVYHDSSAYFSSARLWYGTLNSAAALWDYNSFYAEGSISCGGTKYRIVDTEHYGNIGMNAYETASAMFGDSGSGVIGEDGQTSVFFTPEFTEVIDMNADYQVFITPVSAGSISYTEKGDGFFTVYGDPGTEFDWMISAHQRDYTMNRTETVTLEPKNDVEFDTSIFNSDLAAEEELDEMVADYEQEVDLL